MSDLVAIYEAGDEDVRMVTASNRVEWERTLELLERCLPPAPARVLDIGGGPGRYAAWLAERGYSVMLLDPVPKHVRQARARGVGASEGDARALPYGDALGPLSLRIRAPLPPGRPAPESMTFTPLTRSHNASPTSAIRLTASPG
jgi:SAM-dependent methyltransferase